MCPCYPGGWETQHLGLQLSVEDNGTTPQTGTASAQYLGLRLMVYGITERSLPSSSAIFFPFHLSGSGNFSVW